MIDEDRGLVNLRYKVFQIIEPNEAYEKLSKLFDWFILVLIVLNSLVIFVETFDHTVREAGVFRYLEIFTIVIFTIEYALRVLTADYLFPEVKSSFKARLKYISSPMAIVDMLAILPFFLPFVGANNLLILRMCRILRLFRLLKFSRYTMACNILSKVLRKKSAQLFSAIFVLFILITISAVIMYTVEHEAQPDAFDNAFSSLWWAAVTITSVGYGDVYPITAIGKLLGTVVSVLGVGLIAIPTGIISAGFIEDMTERRKSDLSSTYAPAENNMFVADEILKFKGLLDMGALTQEEFDQKKKQLLNL